MTKSTTPLVMPTGLTVSNPPAGSRSLFPKSDGWYDRTSDGAESRLTEGHMIRTGGPLWIAGRYYTPNLLSTTSSATLSISRLYLAPMYFPRTRSVDRIGINVATAGGAGSVARLGLYNADPDTNLPTTVLLDASTVTIASTGAKEATINQSLSGFVWLAVTGSAAAVLSGHTNDMVPALVGAPGIGSLTAYKTIYFDTAAPASALPSLVGSTLTYATGTTPAVALRAA